ncbi:MAG: cytochrome C [Gammaproteobacteria bacterium]|nr:cytochrome C [Gammaproteobacteria bacterium]
MNAITRIALALCASFAACLPATAQDSAVDLLEVKRCYICHEMTQTIIGPPYAAIAARHGQRRDVMTEVLARKIVNGGGGNWGLVPMVPNQWVSLDEARTMADWILSLNAEQ